MTDYYFERLSDSNLSHLVYLYRHAFNHKTDLSFLNRKYNTQMFGKQFIGYLAFEKQTKMPAAYYGVFPIKCKLNNTFILAAQSGDTMTHPKHQGKGLFIQLAKLTFDLAAKEDIEFVFGFPNKNSYPGFIRKLNWQHYADINNYVIKTGAIPLDKIVKKFAFLSRIYEAFVSQSLKKIATESTLENSLSLQLPEAGYVVHDSNFYTYKSYHKIHLVNIKGVKCVVKVDGRLWVGDMDACDEITFGKTLIHLKALAEKLSCASIQFSVFQNSPLDLYLQKHLEPKSKNPVCSLNLSNKINSTSFAYQALDFDTY